MRFTARGWSRNMGAWAVGDFRLAPIAPLHTAGSYTVYMGSPTLNVRWDDGVEIAWGKKLTLSGNFLLTVSLSKEDISTLFKLAIGEVLTEEVVQETGLSVDDGVVRDRLRAMNVGQLFDLLESRHSRSESSDSATVEDFDEEATTETDAT